MFHVRNTAPTKSPLLNWFIRWQAWIRTGNVLFPRNLFKFAAMSSSTVGDITFDTMFVAVNVTAGLAKLDTNVLTPRKLGYWVYNGRLGDP